MNWSDIGKGMQRWWASSRGSSPESPPQVPRSVAGLFGSSSVLAGTMVENYVHWVQRSENRAGEMRFYDTLSAESAECDAALDAFASMATTGSLSSASRATFSLQVVREPNGPPPPPAVTARLQRLNRLIVSHAHPIVRGMGKYGSYPTSLVIGDVGGGLGVVDLNHLPPATMYRRFDADGVGDTAAYWVQKIDDVPQGTFPRWMIVHFALWKEVVSAQHTMVYGTSILKRAARSAIQMSGLQDGLVVHRLSRAAQRMLYSIPCDDLNNEDDKIVARLSMYKKWLEREKYRVPAGGGASFQRPPIPDEDYVMPTLPGGGPAVSVLEGDANVGNIDDIKFAMQAFLGALGVPPEYVGHERSQGGRSVISQLDIQFARSSRYLQLFASAGFETMAAVDLILAGYNPEDYQIRCIPPTIGARDDLLRAQVIQLHSQVLSNLKAAGMDFTVDPRWVLRTFMQIDDETLAMADNTVAKIFVNEPVAEPGGAGMPDGDGDTGRKRMNASHSHLSDEQVQRVLAGTEELRQSIATLQAIERGGSVYSAYDNIFRPDGVPGNVRRDQPSLEELRRTVLRDMPVMGKGAKAK